ncbi:MAG: tetratricopeptide repeat protein [Bacteroidota bacterium]|jgi:tetratricopeptide (TPR) repeat protein
MTKTAITNFEQRDSDRIHSENFERDFERADKEHRYREALRLVDRELARIGESTRLRKKRAELNYNYAKFEDAIKDYSIVLSRIPNDTEALLERAASRLSPRHYNSAIEDSEKYLKAGGEPTARYHMILGLAYRGIKKYAHAIAEFEHAWKVDKAYSGSLWAIARTYDQIGRYMDAVEKYTYCMSVFGKTGIGCYFRGMASIKCGQIQNGIIDITEVLLRELQIPFVAEDKNVFKATIKDIDLPGYLKKKERISLFIRITRENGRRARSLSTSGVKTAILPTRPSPTLGVETHLPKYALVKRGVDMLLEEMRIAKPYTTLEMAKREYATSTKDTYANVNRLYHYHTKRSATSPA